MNYLFLLSELGVLAADRRLDLQRGLLGSPLAAIIGLVGCRVVLASRTWSSLRTQRWGPTHDLGPSCTGCSRGRGSARSTSLGILALRS